MSRFAVSVPPSGRELVSLAAFAIVPIALVALATGAPETLPSALAVAAGVVGILAGVLATAYAIFILSRLAVLEVGRDTVRLHTKTVTRPTTRPGSLRWRGRSWTILDISGGGNRIRVGCPDVGNDAPRPPSPADDAPGMDGITTIDELLEITQAIEQPDVTLLALPDSRGEQRRTARREKVWIPFLVVVVGATVILPRQVGNSALQRALAPVLVIGALSIAFVISQSREVKRSRRRLPDSSPSTDPRHVVPAIEQGPSSPATSFWVALFRVLGIVAISMAIPFVLFALPYEVVKAFERHVDVPGCRTTCQTNGLLFDSYSWAKTGSICLCRPADHPESWQVFHENYNVVGGRAWWAGVLDIVIRAVAAVGTFCLELASIFLVLIGIKRFRSK